MRSVLLERVQEKDAEFRFKFIPPYCADISARASVGRFFLSRVLTFHYLTSEYSLSCVGGWRSNFTLKSADGTIAKSVDRESVQGVWRSKKTLLTVLDYKNEFFALASNDIDFFGNFRSFDFAHLISGDLLASWIRVDATSYEGKFPESAINESSALILAAMLISQFDYWGS